MNVRGVALDVQGGRDREGQNVVVWKKHNGLNQKWRVVYADADSVQNGLIPNKPFRLVTAMKSNRVLTRTGNNVVIRDRNDREEQIFVFDSKSKSIQPFKNQKVSLDISDFGKGRSLVWKNRANVWTQKFNFRNQKLVNERGLALDVQGGRDKQNQPVVAWKKHRGINQKWRVDYV